MMAIEHETERFELWYHSRYGEGVIRRKADGAETPMITGTDMVELRRQLNSMRTNGAGKRRFFPRFNEIADYLFSEYFATSPGEPVS